MIHPTEVKRRIELAADARTRCRVVADDAGVHVAGDSDEDRLAIVHACVWGATWALEQMARAERAEAELAELKRRVEPAGPACATCGTEVGRGKWWQAVPGIGNQCDACHARNAGGVESYR